MLRMKEVSVSTPFTQLRGDEETKSWEHSMRACAPQGHQAFAVHTDTRPGAGGAKHFYFTSAYTPLTGTDGRMEDLAHSKGNVHNSQHYSCQKCFQVNL